LHYLYNKKIIKISLDGTKKMILFYFDMKKCYIINITKITIFFIQNWILTKSLLLFIALIVTSFFCMLITVTLFPQPAVVAIIRVIFWLLCWWCFYLDRIMMTFHWNPVFILYCCNLIAFIKKLQELHSYLEFNVIVIQRCRNHEQVFLLRLT